MTTPDDTPRCTTQAHTPAPAGTGPCPHDCGYPRCNGTTHTGRCRKQPMKGASVCRTHGGSAPQVRAAAERREQERAAGEVLAHLVWNPQAEPLTDSVGEMRRLAGSMRAAADTLGSRLNGSGACESCGRGPEPLDGTTGTAWVRVLRELRQLLADMERLGIANRANEIEAEKVEVMYAAYVASQDAVPELLPEQRTRQLSAFLVALGVPPDVVAGELVS